MVPLLPLIVDSHTHYVFDFQEVIVMLPLQKLLIKIADESCYYIC